MTTIDHLETKPPIHATAMQSREYCVVLKGETSLELVIPAESMIAMMAAGRVPADPALRRALFLDTFRPFVSNSLDEPVTLEFRPAPEPGANRFFEIHAWSDTYTERRPFESAVERVSIRAESMPGPFALRRMLEAFGKLFSPAFNTHLEVIHGPLSEAEVHEANNKALQRLILPYPPGDPRRQLALGRFFDETYGVSAATILEGSHPIQLANNRGYAYVGPIVFEDTSHMYQLDRADGIIAMHHKPAVTVAHALPVVGQTYAITNTGGLASRVHSVPAGVDVAMGNTIQSIRQWARETGQVLRTPVQGDLPLTMEAIHVVRHPALSEASKGRGEHVEFYVDDFRVADAVPWAKDSIGAAAIDEDDALRCADLGLKIEYLEGCFAVSSRDLKVAAYEQLGWFNSASGLIASTRATAWAQEGDGVRTAARLRLPGGMSM